MQLLSTQFRKASATLLRKGRWDVVHAHDAFSGMLLNTILPKYLPLIVSPHGSINEEHEQLNTGSARLSRDYVEQCAKMEIDGWNSGKLVCCSSQWIADKVIASGRDAAEVSVIPYGLNIESIEAQFRKGPSKPAPEGKRVLLAIGRQCKIKGQAILLRALSQLKQRHDWELWFAGDGPDRVANEKLARDLGIADRVEFLGDRQDIPRLLAAAYAMVHPSTLDCLPLAISEAMICGIPVVTTDAGGIPEMVRHGETGLITKAGEPEPLARDIETLLDDESLARRLGSAGMNWILANRKQADYGNKYLEIYQRLVQPRTTTSHGIAMKHQQPSRRQATSIGRGA